MLAWIGDNSYRDDMNLLSWTPPDSPQARHCSCGLLTSNTLLLSTTLSILCVCFLLYLLTALNKPRRSAQAAIFPALARSQDTVLHSWNGLRVVFLNNKC